jgi:hypothetical protein
MQKRYQAGGNFRRRLGEPCPGRHDERPRKETPDGWWPTALSLSQWPAALPEPAALPAVAGGADRRIAGRNRQPSGPASATRASTDKAVTSCGTTKTAANVPVRVHIQHGPASCEMAMSVERRYARAILAGKAPGNGGGGPVHINGWICQGFPTPTVLASGKASKCVKGAAEILAILPAPA